MYLSLVSHSEKNNIGIFPIPVFHYLMNKYYPYIIFNWCHVLYKSQCPMDPKHGDIKGMHFISFMQVQVANTCLVKAVLPELSLEGSDQILEN